MLVPLRIGRFLVFTAVIATACLFFSLAPRAQAESSLYVVPTSGTFVVGSTFSVSIYLNTGGQNVNAVQASLSFPPDKLQIVSPTAGRSLIQIWVSQPTYSNEKGTMTFQGTIPTPGINTEAGLISTVTFRVKSTGIAVVNFLDGSQVLLNDGRGTNILGERTSGIYYLTLPPPQGPIVTSRTNPDQERWYNNKAVVFEWTAPPDIQAYSYILDQNAGGEPDDISEGTSTRVVYNNLADGVYYFHIKGLRQGAWGGISDYVVSVDTTPPAAFKINLSPNSRTSNRRPIIDFGTTDTASGLDHYELKIIPLDLPVAVAGQNNTPFFIETSPPYSRDLDDGRYQVVVRAYDRADNYYQAESTLTIVKPLFEFISGEGLRIGGVYNLSWSYVGIIGTIILALLIYFSRIIWKWHRQVEEHLREGALKHPAVAPKLEELKAKQKEYGSPRSGAGSPRDRDENGGGSGGGNLMALLLIFAMVSGFSAYHKACAEQGLTSNVGLEPPVVTLFPKSISNDEILYMGGRAGAPQAQVVIYLQQLETGSTISETAVTDKNGAWFYSFQRFLDAGNYIAWTQLKVAGESSAPSPRMDLLVAKTAIQIGNSRLSYQDFYLVLFLIFLTAFFGLIIFFSYYAYHFKAKNRRLAFAIKEAEESIRRGFSVLHHDIEAELALIHKAKLSKELSAEERLREEKLVKDLESIANYIGKEVWKIEEAEKEL